MTPVLSNQPRLVTHFARTSAHFVVALGACMLTACGTADIDHPESGADPALGETAIAPEQIAALRVASPVEADEDHTIDARLQEQAERGQRYLDELTPKLDGALRATAGVTYAELKAEVDAAVALGDTDAAYEALDRFHEERGPIVEAALEQLGLSSAAVAAGVRRASVGDASPLVAAGAEVGADEGGPLGADLEPIGICQSGFEFEPFPPYFEAGGWGTGSAGTSNGFIYARSEALFGGAPTDGAWLRADNLPPAGGGFTTVSTRVNFDTIQSTLTVFLPAYAGSGVGLTIKIFDNGPGGALIRECRRPVLDLAIGWGFVNHYAPQLVEHSCSVGIGSSTFFLTSKVQLDTYATTVGAQAIGMGRGVVENIRYSTCQ